MITTAPSGTVIQSAVESRPSRLLSWGAILAGCFAALSIHILLTMLGIGLGVRLVDPLTNDNPVGDFSVAAGIVWSISALVAMAIGGWVAGRSIDMGERRTGGLHGVLVWSLSTVVVFLFMSGGAGLALSGAASAIGKGVSGAANVAGQAAPRAAEAMPGENWADDIVGGFVNEARLPGQQGELPVAAKREIAWSLTRFAAQPNAERRNAVVTSLTNAGAPRDAAEGMVQRWEEQMNRLRAQVDEMKAEAALAARQAADKAASGLSQGAIWTFVAFLLGGVAAGIGGRMGAKSAMEAPVREFTDAYPRREDVSRP